MSFSWTYLTRRFVLQNYRDAIAATIIFSFFTSKFLTYNSRKAENDYTLVSKSTWHCWCCCYRLASTLRMRRTCPTGMCRTRLIQQSRGRRSCASRSRSGRLVLLVRGNCSWTPTITSMERITRFDYLNTFLI